MSFNQFMLLGNLTRDTDLRTSEAGINYAFFDLAVTTVRGKGDEKQEKSNFFRVKCFGEMASNAGKYLGKGSKVFVSGHLENTVFEKDGKKEYSNDFIADKIEYAKTNPPEETKE